MKKLYRYSTFEELKASRNAPEQEGTTPPATIEELNEFFSILRSNLVKKDKNIQPPTDENYLVSKLGDVCRSLHKYHVKHLLIGGTAVAVHGYYLPATQHQTDVPAKHAIDFWYDSTYDNYFRLLRAMNELGLDTDVLENDTTPNPKKSFLLAETDSFTLNFLPQLKGPLKFGTSFRSRAVISIADTEIWLISLDDLIKDKQENARSKDLQDLAELEKIREQAN